MTDDGPIYLHQGPPAAYLPRPGDMLHLVRRVAHSPPTGAVGWHPIFGGDFLFKDQYRILWEIQADETMGSCWDQLQRGWTEAVVQDIGHDKRNDSGQHDAGLLRDGR